MLVCFELSMPGINSWNGKWSGEGRLYARVESFRSKKAIARAKEMVSTGYYHYDFGDGWRAGVTVREVDTKEARKIRAKTQGFYGYDWMVDSIKRDDVIKPTDRKV
jgi:hypothetical protein